MIEKFLEGNKRFIEQDFSKDYEYYQQLSRGQSPTALWIGCSDSRVNPERVAGAKMGEIFVHRNIGNIAPENDINLATVLEYAVNHLKVQDVVVYGHSDCGAMKALDKGAHGDEYIPLWLKHAEGAKERANAQMPSPAGPEQEKERRRLIEFENIKLQLEHLRAYPLVKKAEDEGRIALHGLYYDLETGKLSKVV
ncbi:MAG: carbonic anhydrase [Methanomicrobiales archaeon]|nr:carbonic anhydrase [Methanomicrobiales archaeon]